jgi:Uma2 family endonuclease
MATKTLVTCEEYIALEETQGVRYELSEGELIVTPSASFFHNKIGYYLVATMGAFAESQGLGDVIGETDVRLVGETVRRPDVAFIRAGRLRGIDLDRVPLPVVPDLVIEIVSRSDRADDLILKVSQYLSAGAKAVWLLYPNTQQAYRYVPDRLEPEVRSAAAGHRLEEPELLPGLTLPLAQIFPAAETPR